jgi:hypothetical protein
MTKDEQLEVLNILDKLPLGEAKAKALDIISTFSTKSVRQIASINQLTYDVETANTSKYVCESMWRSYLASQGMRVIGSTWDKHYRGI